MIDSTLVGFRVSFVNEFNGVGTDHPELTRTSELGHQDLRHSTFEISCINITQV